MQIINIIKTSNKNAFKLSDILKKILKDFLNYENLRFSIITPSIYVYTKRSH
ncbi:hypothetical protein MARBORIA2_10460 [Methanobrevibacter arboriphilus]|nr:hypothetical protein MARBORIA2_10460 [Methanobrevibacter arboriphilus]